jgi:hypothetical protein
MSFSYQFDINLQKVQLAQLARGLATKKQKTP